MPDPKTPKRPTAGAPPKLDRARLDRLVGLVRAGVYDETAAESIGIHRMTLRDWMRRGMDELFRRAAGKAPTKNEFLSLCAEAAEAISQARAEAERGAVAIVLQGMKGSDGRAPDSRLALDWLSRRYPTRYSERARLAARELIDEDLGRLKNELDEETFARVAEILTRRDS